MAATSAKRKPANRTIYFRVEKLMRPETGEEVGALVPLTQWDQRAMRERKMHVGIELRANLKQRRNVKWWRLAHILGAFLADHVEGFEGLSMHDAIKKLQELSGIGCIEETFDLGNLGVIKRSVAESLNFEDMDEGRWAELWSGWVEWLRREKWGALDASKVEEVEQMILGEH